MSKYLEIDEYAFDTTLTVPAERFLQGYKKIHPLQPGLNKNQKDRAKTKQKKKAITALEDFRSNINELDSYLHNFPHRHDIIKGMIDTIGTMVDPNFKPSGPEGKNDEEDSASQIAEQLYQPAKKPKLFNPTPSPNTSLQISKQLLTFLQEYKPEVCQKMNAAFKTSEYGLDLSAPEERPYIIIPATSIFNAYYSSHPLRAQNNFEETQRVHNNRERVAREQTQNLHDTIAILDVSLSESPNDIAAALDTTETLSRLIDIYTVKPQKMPQTTPLGSSDQMVITQQIWNEWNKGNLKHLIKQVGSTTASLLESHFKSGQWNSPLKLTKNVFIGNYLDKPPAHEKASFTTVENLATEAWVLLDMHIRNAQGAVKSQKDEMAAAITKLENTAPTNNDSAVSVQENEPGRTIRITRRTIRITRDCWNNLKRQNILDTLLSFCSPEKKIDLPQKFDLPSTSSYILEKREFIKDFFACYPELREITPDAAEDQWKMLAHLIDTHSGPAAAAIKKLQITANTQDQQQFRIRAEQEMARMLPEDASTLTHLEIPRTVLNMLETSYESSNFLPNMNIIFKLSEGEFLTENNALRIPITHLCDIYYDNHPTMSPSAQAKTVRTLLHSFQQTVNNIHAICPTVVKKSNTMPLDVQHVLTGNVENLMESLTLFAPDEEAPAQQQPEQLVLERQQLLDILGAQAKLAKLNKNKAAAAIKKLQTTANAQNQQQIGQLSAGVAQRLSKDVEIFQTNLDNNNLSIQEITDNITSIDRIVDAIKQEIKDTEQILKEATERKISKKNQSDIRNLLTDIRKNRQDLVDFKRKFKHRLSQMQNTSTNASTAAVPQQPGNSVDQNTSPAVVTPQAENSGNQNETLAQVQKQTEKLAEWRKARNMLSDPFKSLTEDQINLLAANPTQLNQKERRLLDRLLGKPMAHHIPSAYSASTPASAAKPTPQPKKKNNNPKKQSHAAAPSSHQPQNHGPRLKPNRANMLGGQLMHPRVKESLADNYEMDEMRERAPEENASTTYLVPERAPEAPRPAPVDEDVKFPEREELSCGIEWMPQKQLKGQIKISKLSGTQIRKLSGHHFMTQGQLGTMVNEKTGRVQHTGRNGCWKLEFLSPDGQPIEEKKSMYPLNFTPQQVRAVVKQTVEGPVEFVREKHIVRPDGSTEIRYINRGTTFNPLDPTNRDSDITSEIVTNKEGTLVITIYPVDF